MVAPITDRGTSTVSWNQIDEYGHTWKRFYSFKHRYRQKKPFTLILPYSAEYHYVQSYSLSSASATIPWDANTVPFGDVNWTPVLNRSYEQLRAKVYDKVGLGVDLAEYKQSAATIVGTATTLRRAYQAVRAGRFGDAAQSLRMKYFPKGVSPAKSAGNNWLEFHFGWEPLYKDIHEALEVINSPVKHYAYERSRVRDPFTWRQVADLGSVIRTSSANGYLSCQQGLRVKMTAPGSGHTLDQWGISNPLAIAWELVPYSFVVDWFVNVGNFLDSQSDFNGLALDATYRTLHYDISVDAVSLTKSGFSPQWGSRSVTRFVTTDRATSLSGIALEVKKFKSPSLVRAATAISLLTKAMR